MNAYTIATIMGICVIPVLVAMWFAWRARARRDAGVATDAVAPSGSVLAHFDRAGYVSTTPEGSPLERVALPGLRYRGNAEVTVREDGVSIRVTGEAPVHVAADRVRGSGIARTRVGKAVERDGLALLRWDAGDRHLESSFRMGSPADQHAFAAAVDAVVRHTTDEHHTTQEDA